MENIFFKYAVILVGGVIIMLLINFAFQALNSTVRIPGREDDNLGGDALMVIDGLEKACDLCLDDLEDKDCSIKTVDSPREILATEFREDVILSGMSIPAGRSTIKVSTQDKECRLRRLK